MPILLLAAAAVAATPATDTSVRQFREKDAVTINPGKAYLTIRTDYRAGVQLFRSISDADRQTWETQRQEAYAKARKKYERDLRRFEADDRDWEKGTLADRRMIGKKPVRPTEVTLESVSVAPIELANFVTVTGAMAVAKDERDVRTLLIELPPGNYRIHGVPAMMGGIGTGSCLCFGSVGFTLAAGQVADGGSLIGGSNDYFALPVYTPPTATPPALAKLPGYPVVAVKPYAVGKFANWHATPVTRLQPVAGVLAYDRDIPIDVANGNAKLSAIR